MKSIIIDQMIEEVKEEMCKTITEQIEEVKEEMCNNYCKYPTTEIPKGKNEDWLFCDADSPCNDCPLNRL